MKSTPMPFEVERWVNEFLSEDIGVFEVNRAGMVSACPTVTYGSCLGCCGP
jgi:hypothetical protein